jgi:6-pyruvoyltetrahydropterin/6-carboxytetrahydropterin synthase
MSKVTATRFHDFSMGHRVAGQGGHCEHLHGHNYRIHFTCEAESGIDSVGRVIDFSVIKSTLCQWLEDNWDHKFVYWEDDPVMNEIIRCFKHNHQGLSHNDIMRSKDSFVAVPFNPTAENMAQYLVVEIAPKLLEGAGVTLVQCVVEETRKCSAGFHL